MPTEEFYAGQQDYIPKLNSLWDRATVSVIGTSTDSLSLTTGSKTFTTQTYLQYTVGTQVTITNSADLSKYMSGQVTAYNNTTGSITVNVLSVIGTGTFSTWSISLSGAAGATGATGATGAAGAPNVLSIGTVNVGTAGASITGTSPSQILNLTLPTAPPNTLTIGTVTSGTAGASITGTAPNQVLNLTLQTGAKGDKGTIFRGAWSAGTAYAVDDLSTFSGTTYIRLIAGTTATAPSSDSTNWAVFAAKGADGAGTVAGVTASAPLASTGGANPNITITLANTSTSGYLSNTDWNTFNGKANISDITAANFSGTLAITKGGTGATTAQAAINALAGAVTSGSYLRGNGTNVVMSTIQAADVPTLNQNTTGTAANVTGIVAGANGGTGVNNSGKTITLGGNLTLIGAFASVFTITAATSLTLPTSGTLATLAGVETLVGKTLTGVGYTHVDKGTVSSGTVTFDYSAATSQRVQIGGAVTFAVSNWAASGTRAILLLEIVNGGSAAITLPTINFIKPDGTLTTSVSTYLTAIGRASLQSSGVDFMILWTRDAGTTVYGKFL